MENLTKLETPNFNYFDALNNPDLKIKMIELLLAEFTDAKDHLLIYLENKNTEELVHCIHKLSSKFSLLEMKETYILSKKLEDELRENLISEKEITQFHGIVVNTIPYLS